MSCFLGKCLKRLINCPLGEKEELINVLNRRIIEARRDELAQDIEEANREFQEGKALPITPDDLMKEITV